MYYYVFGYLEVEHCDYPCHKYAYTTSKELASKFGIISIHVSKGEAKAKVRKLES